MAETTEKKIFYCFCQAPDDADGNGNMICCEECEDWFHDRCVFDNIPESLEYYKSNDFVCCKCLGQDEEVAKCHERIRKFQSVMRKKAILAFAGAKRKPTDVKQMKENMKRMKRLRAEAANSSSSDESSSEDESIFEIAQRRRVEQKRRDNLRSQFQAALADESIAAALEQKLFDLSGGSSAGDNYQARGAVLVLNLRDKENEELREHIRSGVYSLEHVCTVDEKQLANPRLRAEREEQERERIRLHTRVAEEEPLPKGTPVSQRDEALLASSSSSSSSSSSTNVGVVLDAIDTSSLIKVFSNGKLYKDDDEPPVVAEEEYVPQTPPLPSTSPASNQNDEEDRDDPTNDPKTESPHLVWTGELDVSPSDSKEKCLIQANLVQIAGPYLTHLPLPVPMRHAGMLKTELVEQFLKKTIQTNGGRRRKRVVMLRLDLDPASPHFSNAERLYNVEHGKLSQKCCVFDWKEALGIDLYICSEFCKRPTSRVTNATLQVERPESVWALAFLTREAYHASK